jgi:hypothetical protein
MVAEPPVRDGTHLDGIVSEGLAVLDKYAMGAWRLRNHAPGCAAEDRNGLASLVHEVSLVLTDTDRKLRLGKTMDRSKAECQND